MSEPIKIKLKAFVPWRKTGEVVKVNVDVAGLELDKRSLALPGVVNVSVPEGSDPGLLFEGYW